MTDNAPPSRNPTNDGTLLGAFAVAFEKFLQNTDDMLPAKVVAYNRTTNRAQVQPLISILTSHNQVVARSQVMSIPVLQLGGAGFLISFPLAPGSLGWIKSNDRDVSIFNQSAKSTIPATARKHSFEDAMFIPDVMAQGVTIAAEDVNNAVLQNLTGSVRLALWAELMKITAPSLAIGDTDSFASSPHALLDLVSTTRALGLPAMTTGQKNAIPSPRPGFQVFDTTLDSVSTFRAGGGWTP